MARFSAVIIMVLMTSTALAAPCVDGEDNCSVEGSSMVGKKTEIQRAEQSEDEDGPPMGRAARRIAREQLTYSRQSASAALNAQQAKTPPAPAPAAVESGDLPLVPAAVEEAMASGVNIVASVPNLGDGPSTPDELMALSREMAEGSSAAKDSLDKMRVEQKKARSLSIAHDRQSLASDDAETAAVGAADAHVKAEDFTKNAAETRDQANSAISTMSQSKTMFEQKQELEYTARQFTSDQQKIEKRLQVRFEAAQMKSARMRAYAAHMDEETAIASLEHRKREDAQVIAEKELAEAKEKLSRAAADQAEKVSMFEYAEEKLAEISQKHNYITMEFAAANQDLGAKQAADAQAEVEFEEATHARDFAMNDHIFKQTEALDAEGTATELIARARAGAETATALATGAKDDADNMGEMP